MPTLKSKTTSPDYAMPSGMKSSYEGSGIMSGDFEALKKEILMLIKIPCLVPIYFKLNSHPYLIGLTATYVKPAKISLDSAHSTRTNTPRSQYIGRVRAGIVSELAE